MRSSTLRPTARSSWRPSSEAIRGSCGPAPGDRGPPPPTSRTSSTSSSAPATSPTTPAAPGWGCRSSSRSSTATRDGSGSTRSSGAVRLSPSFCRAPTPEGTEQRAAWSLQLPNRVPPRGPLAPDSHGPPPPPPPPPPPRRKSPFGGRAGGGGGGEYFEEGGGADPPPFLQQNNPS